MDRGCIRLRPCRHRRRRRRRHRHPNRHRRQARRRCRPRPRRHPRRHRHHRLGALLPTAPATSVCLVATGSSVKKITTLTRCIACPTMAVGVWPRRRRRRRRRRTRWRPLRATAGLRTASTLKASTGLTTIAPGTTAMWPRATLITLGAFGPVEIAARAAAARSSTPPPRRPRRPRPCPSRRRRLRHRARWALRPRPTTPIAR